jgi:hypothetical protein
VPFFKGVRQPKIMCHWLASSQAVILPLFAPFSEKILHLVSKLQPCRCHLDLQIIDNGSA